MEVSSNNFTVWTLFDKTARIYAEKEAVYDLTRRMNYSQLKLEAEQAAALLLSLGVKTGDKVGIALPNWHETVILFLASARIGAVLVPFNPKYRSFEMYNILQNSGAKLVFVSAEFENVDYDHIKPLVQEIITVRYNHTNFRSYENLMAQVEVSSLPEISINAMEDVFCILYTSGTTGVPKGALITHHALVQSGITISKGMRCTDSDVFLIVAPIFHVFGLGCNLLSAIYCGANMVLLDKFKARKALELIQEERITIQHAVPSMLNLELKDPDFNSFDVSSLRAGITGAAPCPPEVIRAVREKLGMVLAISYGTTETCTVTITEYQDEEINIFETIGKAVPGVEMKIVDEHRQEVKYGEIGEITCRGFGVMKEYYKMPEQTKEVLDSNGWFYTGDLGTMDSNGYVRYVGRKKEVIIRGGFNIYPQEVEGLIQNHPKVLDCALVGLPDPVMGEIVCAAVRLRPGETAIPEEIIEYLKALIAPYKLPSRITFMEELPSTASGKIQKAKLKEMLLTT